MNRIPGILWLLLLTGALVLAAHSLRIFDHFPDSVHRWRQSDCASYTKTFYRNNTGLLTPGTFNLAGKGGRVASEFPIIYYLSAKIEKAVGEHYWVNRSINFLLYFLGLWALLSTFTRYLFRGQRFAAFCVVALLASAPFYYYYALNFLPNVPAISLSFIGLYFLFGFREKGSLLNLLWATLAFTLALLLKPTDGGILLGAYGLMAATLFMRKPPEGKENLRFWAGLAVSVAVVLLVNYLWIRYVNAYNDLNGNHQNLVSIYPIWEMQPDVRNYTVKRILTEWRLDFHHLFVLATLPFFLGICLFKWRALEPRLKWLTAYIFLLTGLYSVLWFKAYTDHDYYQLPLVLPMVFLAATAVEYLARMAGRQRSPLAAGLLATSLATLVAIGVFYNGKAQQRRYADPGNIHPVPELYWSEAYLNSIGVTPDKIVVCVPDKSPNISLNAINRYGHTEEFNDANYNINTFKQKGASYLIVLDSAYLNDPLYKPYVQKKIGQFGRVQVFDIR